MYLVNNCDALMRGVERGDPDKLYMASEFDDSYMDLGGFLLSEFARQGIVEYDPARAGIYDDYKRAHTAAIHTNLGPERASAPYWIYGIAMSKSPPPTQPLTPELLQQIKREAKILKRT